MNKKADFTTQTGLAVSMRYTSEIPDLIIVAIDGEVYRLSLPDAAMLRYQLGDFLKYLYPN